MAATICTCQCMMRRQWDSLSCWARRRCAVIQGPVRHDACISRHLWQPGWPFWHTPIKTSSVKSAIQVSQECACCAHGLGVCRHSLRPPLLHAALCLQVSLCPLQLQANGPARTLVLPLHKARHNRAAVQLSVQWLQSTKQQGARPQQQQERARAMQQGTRISVMPGSLAKQHLPQVQPPAQPSPEQLPRAVSAFAQPSKGVSWQDKVGVWSDGLPAGTNQWKHLVECTTAAGHLFPGYTTDVGSMLPSWESSCGRLQRLASDMQCVRCCWLFAMAQPHMACRCCSDPCISVYALWRACRHSCV
jgi:hypothetical protein